MSENLLTEMILKASKGNPGAISVLCELAKADLRGQQALSILLFADLEGHEIWMIYKDKCKSDHEKLIDHILSKEADTKEFLRGKLKEV